MNYDLYFAKQLDGLKREGNYRVFANLEREAGAFPKAKRHGHRGASDVVVWCSNDYLGMGQHPDVIAAMHAALDSSGAGAGGTRNIAGTNRHHVELEAELADLRRQSQALKALYAVLSPEQRVIFDQRTLPPSGEQQGPQMGPPRQ